VYKGSHRGETSALLRSYDSRKETAIEPNCKIWEAGRATSAAALAFKPIQVGQSVFLDEGGGKYNPSPQVLDEAVCNEWPGREVGVFVSIGTGKRPSNANHQQHLWWESFVGPAIGDFAEARKRLLAKIEGCEETHQYMLAEYLSKRSVPVENYIRLNVEVGVGEFGMNGRYTPSHYCRSVSELLIWSTEWSRLSDISTSTRKYLTKPDVTDLNNRAAAKLAQVELAHRRQTRHVPRPSYDAGEERWDRPVSTSTLPPPSNPLAVELPAEDVPTAAYHAHRPHPLQYMHHPSVADMKYTVISSDEFPQPIDSPRTSQQLPYRPNIPRASRSDPWVPKSPPALPPQPTNQRLSIDRSSLSSPRSPPQQHQQQQSHQHQPHQQSQHQQQQQQPQTIARASPPPLPPKTPLPYPDNNEPGPRTFTNMGNMGRGGNLPYPESDAPPPVVNMARKPEFGVR